METRNLGGEGRAGLVTSALGFGCMGLSQGYGPADDEQSLRVLHRALDLGVTMLDTAMSYGGGHNERLLARVLAGRREQVVVATKLGITRDDHGVRLDGRPEHVRGYAEASLSRLGIDVIDLYYLHRVDPEVPVAETIGALAELVQDGLVRHIGLSEATPEQLEQAVAAHPVTAVQFEWSLLWQEPQRDLVPAARRLGVGLVPYSPLGRGLLSASLAVEEIDASDFRRTDPRFHGPDLEHNLKQIAALRGIADGLGLTTGQLALAWLLAQGPDVVPVPGTRRPERVDENVAAAAVRLSDADLRRIDELVPHAGWSGDRRSFAVPVTTRSA
jgi:aryl-alcohol dehydrogenase-like predicted oxidoreductase